MVLGWRCRCRRAESSHAYSLIITLGCASHCWAGKGALKKVRTHCQVCCNSLTMTFRHWGKSHTTCSQLASDSRVTLVPRLEAPYLYPDLASTCLFHLLNNNCSCINCWVPCRHHNPGLCACYLSYRMPLISFLWQTKCYPLLRIQCKFSSPGRVL